MLVELIIRVKSLEEARVIDMHFPWVDSDHWSISLVHQGDAGEVSTFPRTVPVELVPSCRCRNFGAWNMCKRVEDQAVCDQRNQSGDQAERDAGDRPSTQNTQLGWCTIPFLNLTLLLRILYPACVYFVIGMGAHPNICLA